MNFKLNEWELVSVDDYPTPEGAKNFEVIFKAKTGLSTTDFIKLAKITGGYEEQGDVIVYQIIIFALYFESSPQAHLYIRKSPVTEE